MRRKCQKYCSWSANATDAPKVRVASHPFPPNHSPVAAQEHVCGKRRGRPWNLRRSLREGDWLAFLRPCRRKQTASRIREYRKVADVCGIRHVMPLSRSQQDAQQNSSSNWVDDGGTGRVDDDLGTGAGGIDAARTPRCRGRRGWRAGFWLSSRVVSRSGMPLWMRESANQTYENKSFGRTSFRSRLFLVDFNLQPVESRSAGMIHARAGQV
jgi:hypothetical protein